MKEEKQLQKELTEQDIVCMARVLQSTIFKDSLFWGCRYCKFYDSCYEVDEKKASKLAGHFNTLRENLERITGVYLGMVHDDRLLRK